MNAGFFTQNRANLLDALSADVAVFAGNISLQRTNDASYAFSQEANFWYLSGINAAGWRLIIEGEHSTLIAPDVDEVHRIFDGSFSDDDAQSVSGVDEVVSFREGEALLVELSKKYPSVASLGTDPHTDHYDFYLNPGPVVLYEKLAETFSVVKDCRGVLAKLRAIKQPVEIDMMQKAIDVTIDAFEKVKANMPTYTAEYEIEADFSYVFRRHGADGHAYDPIVAAGKNACTLHYIQNQAQLQNGQVVVMDIGAQVTQYAADITRTYAYGEVSDRYKAVHAAVETAHHAIIALLKPGLNVREYFEKVDDIMKTALTDLDLLKTDADYRTYFPHSISHGLGIDVHDALGAPEVFLPGMVLTVEPGIYIPDEGIGVRIEDDILITDEGNRNLSARLATGL